ncbi:PD-(D/E)XK motif protein [Ruixingdingia sedimenti]|uniref:PD-(D/E)XK motif protein n=1 Tax=Ruixingdingia sedimenti TaxID=3073604 RepID=A0ABU1FF00_9RHOB|nr:PD-(D/E)XK motif protein [Xinfangfangia sp. LG-4]MDR5655436.1 PD-(D/E)XK motif protein [Xinfangfangia sp. LG-4]
MTGWTEEGILRSWRVLTRQEGGEDWQFVHLADIGPVSIEVGCRFPGGREALIVSFPRTMSAGPGGLPDGRGFDVVLLREEAMFRDRMAISLVRRLEGSLDIFTVMAADVLRCLEATDTRNPRDLADAFIGRVADWQTFMSRKRRPLSSERQLGLMGELWLLDRLMQTRLGAAAVDCWQGPLHAAQDFLIGAGAVEVKSSLAGRTFLARINSLEQLDADRTPLFLAALRFDVADDGTDLVGMVAHLRERMAEAGLSRVFEALLLLSGYDDDHAEHYRRKLSLLDARAFLVDAHFPCLRRQAVPQQVRKVVYTLDVDALEQPALPLDDALSELGIDP